MLYSIKKVHLIGIGGIGMSGIAELLKNKEFVVSGSDIADSPNVQRLIAVSYTHLTLPTIPTV